VRFRGVPGDPTAGTLQSDWIDVDVDAKTGARPAGFEDLGAPCKGTVRYGSYAGTAPCSICSERRAFGPTARCGRPAVDGKIRYHEVLLSLATAASLAAGRSPG
jgi:hypothetical protein